MPYTPTVFTDRVIPPGVSAFELNKMGAGIEAAMALAEQATADSAADFHHGTLAARPTTLTVLDAPYWYLAEDEDGGTPYLWTGTAWENAGGPPGTGRLHATRAPYNAVPDRVDLTDGQITRAAPNTVFSPSANFTAGLVGKTIAVEHSGPGWSQQAQATNGSNAVRILWALLKIVATGGTFTVTYSGQTTAGIAFNASAATLQTALQGLSTIGAGNATVTLTGGIYTITLGAGLDPQQLTASGSGLTNPTNGAAAVASIQNQSLSYGDVGKRIQLPGAGTSGALLDAYIGYIDIVNSNIAYLYSAPPIDGFLQGTPVNAGATGSFTYHTLNWLVTTISGVTDSTHLTITTGLDAGAQADMTGLSVYYGTDSTNQLQAVITDGMNTGKVVDLGAHDYLITGNISAVKAAGTFRMIGSDATVFGVAQETTSTSSCSLLLNGANTDTLANRLRRVWLEGFTWKVPTAHFRGTTGNFGNPAPAEVLARVNGWGILVKFAQNISLHKVIVDNVYSVGFNFQGCRYTQVSNCVARGTWADSFDYCNSNCRWDSPIWGDALFVNCWAINSGDAMFSQDAQTALNGGVRAKHINYVNCHGLNSRLGALAPGFTPMSSYGTIAGCSVRGSNESSLSFKAAVATNRAMVGTVSNPGTGGQVDTTAALANITAGAAGALTTTQMKLYDGAGNSWIGDVTAVANAGKTLTLTARGDQPATIPFTGTNLLAEWGLASDAKRHGLGGADNITVDGFVSHTTSQNTAGDSTTAAALAFLCGESSALDVWNIKIKNILLLNNYQTGISFRKAGLATISDRTGTASSQGIRDIEVDGFLIDGTGFSAYTANRPWPGINLSCGQDITLRNGLILNTDDNATLVPAGATLQGRIRLINVETRDIGRTYTTGAPLANVHDFGTSTTFKAEVDGLHHRNPAGTAGGTQYVTTNVLSRLPNGSRRGHISTDTTVNLWATPTTGDYVVVVGPLWFDGQGPPEGVVTAPPGSMYQNLAGGAGTSFYVKESGTGNTGWQAYGGVGSLAGTYDQFFLARRPTGTGAQTAPRGIGVVDLNVASGTLRLAYAKVTLAGTYTGVKFRTGGTAYSGITDFRIFVCDTSGNVIAQSANLQTSNPEVNGVANTALSGVTNSRVVGRFDSTLASSVTVALNDDIWIGVGGVYTTAGRLRGLLMTANEVNDLPRILTTQSGYAGGNVPNLSTGTNAVDGNLPALELVA